MKHVKQTHIYKIIENSILIFFLISFLIFELGRIFSANNRFNQTCLLSRFVRSRYAPKHKPRQVPDRWLSAR